jgi:glycosyltransferase involved in cell wall biosynthesis
MWARRLVFAAVILLGRPAARRSANIEFSESMAGIVGPTVASERKSAGGKMNSYREGRAKKPFVSIVVPVFNEEPSIDLFVEAIGNIMVDQACAYEIVFVNDGSRDNTLAVLRQAKTRNPAVVIISLSRNFGKEAAMTAGLDHVKGDVVIPIDVDLQDPPELIGSFIERWQAGADVVYGVRVLRESDGPIKRVTASWFYTLFNLMSPVQIPYNSGDFRLMDRRVVEEIKHLRERNRFMKGLMAWPGFRTESVEFERRGRAAGKTSWNYWKLWNFALDGFTSFSTVPLRLWLYVGTTVAFLAFLYALFIVVHALLTGGDVPGYPSLMVAIMFFGGIQLMSIGVVGEYVGRIYHEIKGRPIYIIETME